VKSLEYEALESLGILDRKSLLGFGRQDSYEVEITKELNGPIKEFGTKFWGHICQSNSLLGELFESKTSIKAISYTDRYLASPLPVILLCQLIKELILKTNSEKPSIRVVAMSSSEPKRSEWSRSIYNNWRPDEDAGREEIVKKLLGDDIRVEFYSDRKQVSHARILEILFNNDKLIRIRFDQGVGYWNVNEYSNYPFHVSTDDQFEWIDTKATRLTIVNNQNLPTHVFVTTNLPGSVR
jgi:hypothetical protein